MKTLIGVFLAFMSVGYASCPSFRPGGYSLAGCLCRDRTLIVSVGGSRTYIECNDLVVEKTQYCLPSGGCVKEEISRMAITEDNVYYRDMARKYCE